MKRDTIYQMELINYVMADLRKYGASCMLLTSVATGEIVISAAFPAGRLWEVVDIEDDYIIKRYINNTEGIKNRQ